MYIAPKADAVAVFAAEFSSAENPPKKVWLAAHPLSNFVCEISEEKILHSLSYLNE